MVEEQLNSTEMIHEQFYWNYHRSKFRHGSSGVRVHIHSKISIITIEYFVQWSYHLTFRWHCQAVSMQIYSDLLILRTYQYSRHNLQR